MVSLFQLIQFQTKTINSLNNPTQQSQIDRVKVWKKKECNDFALNEKKYINNRGEAIRSFTLY